MSESESTLDFPFTPVPVRARHNGWTPVRQAKFIAALADSGCVAEACKAVGVGRKSAYRLRERADAESFSAAWDAALDYAAERISDGVHSRALHGVATPIFYKGKQVGERRRYDERLALFILARHYGVAGQGTAFSR